MGLRGEKKQRMRAEILAAAEALFRRDGFEATSDSTFMIERLEREFEGRSLVPTDGALAFLDYLIEDYGDEWVTKQMFHYRWAIEENVDNADIFVALTNSEEANILSALVAKKLGCKKVMSLINRPAYAELVESGAIDVAISPRQITIGSVLSHVRRGDVVKVHSLRRGKAEAIEAVAHGTAEESKVVGRAIEDIKLPAGASINAIVRDKEVMQAHHDTVVETDDHIIMFITDRRQTDEVERLFQVNVKL